MKKKNTKKNTNIKKGVKKKSVKKNIKRKNKNFSKKPFIIVFLICIFIISYKPIKNRYFPPYINDFNTKICDDEPNLPIVKAENKNTPSKDMIDVASHNNNISKSQFEKMKDYGIRIVTVKLTEGATYINPFAENQIKNALSANMKINVYHYARYHSVKKAKKEAQFFVKTAQKIGLPQNSVVIDDVEYKKILKKKNLTYFTNIWLNTVKKTYEKTSIYASKNTYKKKRLNINELGGSKNLWVAYYPKLLNKKSHFLNNFSAWQFSKKLKFTDKNMPKMCFDISMLYNDYFDK